MVIGAEEGNLFYEVIEDFEDVLSQRAETPP